MMAQAAVMCRGDRRLRQGSYVDKKQKPVEMNSLQR